MDPAPNVLLECAKTALDENDTIKAQLCLDSYHSIRKKTGNVSSKSDQIAQKLQRRLLRGTHLQLVDGEE